MGTKIALAVALVTASLGSSPSVSTDTGSSAKGRDASLLASINAPATDWVSLIRSGGPFAVVFDMVSADKDLGTLQGGLTYIAVYAGGSFIVTGYSKGAEQVITATYSNASVDAHQISLWGRVFTFSDDAKLFDATWGLVGHLLP